MKNKNLHILYIENDEQDFWLLQQALQDCTIENKITRLTYAEKAIEWIVKKPGMFDLVITEQDLPGISGIELKKRIDLLGLSIPVIVLSDKEPSEILQDNNNMRDIFFLDKKNDDSYLKDITVLLSKMQNTSTSNIDDESNSVFPFLEDSLKYIQIFDQKAIIKYAYELSAGKNKDKLIGQKIFDFVSFEYQNEVMDIINDVLQTGNPKSFSIKEGNEEDSKRYLFHLFPVQQIGTEYLLASIVIDISRFEKGEIDSMADTAIILDKDGNVIASNFTSSYLTKYSSNDIIGLNICDIIDSKSGSFTRAGIEKVVKSGEPINFVDQQNGNTFDNYIYPIFDTHNKVQYLTVFAHDITNRKSTSKNPEIENTVSNHRIQENKAKNHKEETFKSDSVNIDIHFKQLVDNVKDAGLIVNLDGLITYWSKGAEKLYGYKPKEVLNKSFLHYFLTDDENVKKLNLTNIEKINGVYLQRGAAGKSFQGDISTSTLYDADNQPEQYFITIKDISKQVRLENEFNKFDDRLKQLVEKRTINQKKLIDKFQTEIKLYKKMEEAQRQRSLIQSMITFSAKKILDGGNWAEIIEQSLEKVGSVLKTSRVYIIENEINADGQVVMNLNYEWADEDVVHFISESTFNGITYDSIGLQRWVNQMQNGRMISGEINELPTIEQKALRKRELFSLFAIPILSNDKWIGYLGVDECLANRKWYKAEINALKTVAQIIGKGYQARKDEITLKKSSDYYHTIVENSIDWEYWVNPDGEIIYTSPACQEISGYKAEEFYNDSSLFREMIFKDDRNMFFDKLKTENPDLKETFDFRITDKEGKEIWVSNTGKQVHDEVGKYLGIRGRIRNIQEMMNRETAMSWQTKTLTALHETALELASKHDLQEVLQAILTRSVSLLSASRGSLFLYREETDDLILTLQENPINELKKAIIKRGEGIAGKVLEEGQPVTIDNFSVWNGEKSKREKKTLGAVAGVPIYWGERMLGVLVISESGNNDFSPEEIHLLESFAPLAAAAIEQTNLLSETSKRKHDVEVLLHAENVVVESLSLDEICTRILDQLINVIPYDSASIQLLDRNELEIAYGKGFNNLEKIIGLRFPVPGKNINTEVLNTKKPMILSNIKEKPSKYFTAPHSRIKSWMGIPLIFKGEIFGMLTVDSETPGFFTDKHLELATAFANQVTVAIKNARLYEQTKNDAETKSLLISEINHRVKNNLTAIIGLLFAELNHIKDKKEVSVESVMKNIINRVQGLALVHNLLSTSEWSPILLSDLSKQIIEPMIKAVSSDKKITLNMEPAEIHISAKQANSFAIILNELVTNSIKHAYKEQNFGTISINVEENDGNIVFRYSDDGLGYNEEILSLQKQGVGLYLITKIVQKDLHGELRLQNMNGAEVEIIFKDNG